jgi:hypothetical protein
MKFRSFASRNGLVSNRLSTRGASWIIMRKSALLAYLLVAGDRPMPRVTLLRAFIWIFACGQLACIHAAYAESRSLIPSDAEEAEPEAQQPAPRSAGGEHTAALNRGNGNSNGRTKKAKPGAAGQPEHAGKAAPRGRQPTAEYRRIRDAWHEAIPAAQLADIPEGPRPALVLQPINLGLRIIVTPDHDEGGFSAAEQSQASRALSPTRPTPHPVAPHLLDLVYRAMRHFHAPLVHVISGYRADRAGSRHTQGRAIDMVLPGVSNEQLAAYLRGFAFVGVGVYPKSGFVHLDVRDASFYWIDDSLPDERCRLQQIMGTQAQRVDDKARERGELPELFVPQNEREDRAAARAYERRAKGRRVAAEPARNF